MPDGATRRPHHRWTPEQEEWLRREGPEFPRLVMWERAHGPVPEGHVVIRLDDDPALDELDNFMCIPRSALLRLNFTSPLRSLPPDRELRRAAVLVARIHQRAHDHGRGFHRSISRPSREAS